LDDVVGKADTLLGDISGKRVLCLAAGGGQQSAAFGLLGADVTVFDLSDEMLARDQAAASRYGLPLAVTYGRILRNARIAPLLHDHTTPMNSSIG
jgi:2-polyprenyl-3-methyl-5-hydroxy-6-metoxy-1,4-benzoquinol methylase